MASRESLPYQLPQFPAIPYGRAYFKGIRLEGCLYVDETRFLHALEQERFVFFIRPRRFGKTCWLSLLESCYDRNQAHDFERMFGGLDVLRVSSAAGLPRTAAGTWWCASTSPPSATSRQIWNGSSTSTSGATCETPWRTIPTCFPDGRTAT